MHGFGYRLNADGTNVRRPGYYANGWYEGGFPPRGTPDQSFRISEFLIGN